MSQQVAERITGDDPYEQTRGHWARYRLAAGFAQPGERVIDAACGEGLLAYLLPLSISYVGLDKVRPTTSAGSRHFVEQDLERPMVTPEFEVFVGFETIEHLNDYSNYVKLAKQAREWILLSTPVVPTMHVNPHHKHDFKPGDLREIFEDGDWAHFQTFYQPEESSEVVILKRR